MVDKQRTFEQLLGQGVSISEACRRLSIDRKTGHWWKNGGVIRRGDVQRVVKPVIGRRARAPESGRYLSEDERIQIADGVRAGRSARTIAAQLGRAVTTVARELSRNRSPDGSYRPHAAQAMTRRRRARPRSRRL